MKKYSVPSCRMSLKHKRTFNTLTASVRAIWRTDSVLRATYKGPRALNRRIASGKLCFSKAKKRTDTCELCDGWDYNVQKRIENQISKFETELESLAPFYWKPWEQVCRNRGRTVRRTGIRPPTQKQIKRSAIDLISTIKNKE
jgi:hypothetical protein